METASLGSFEEENAGGPYFEEGTAFLGCLEDETAFSDITEEKLIFYLYLI